MHSVANFDTAAGDRFFPLSSLLCPEPSLGPLPPPRPFLFTHPRLEHTNCRSHSPHGFARVLCPVSVLLLCW